MNVDWCEIVTRLQPLKEKSSITENDYQQEIESCLIMLGWRKTNGTMRPQYTINIGSSNSIRPDIVLFKDGRSVLPIEIKKPTNQFNQRQAEQLISYMRQLKLNIGLFIGDNIQLYYDNPQDKDVSVVFCAEIQKDDSNGSTICDLLSYDKFTVENIEKFCQEQYQYRIKHNDLQRYIHKFCENGEAVKSLIKENFLREGFEEKILEEELSKISVDVRRRDMVAPFPHEYRETPIRREERNKEFTYQGTTYRNKRKFVLSFIKEYVADHPGISFSELKKQFPDDLASSRERGVVRTLTSVEKMIEVQKQKNGYSDILDKNRYFLHKEEILVLNDGTKVVVNSQWGTAFPKFRDYIEKMGWRPSVTLSSAVLF